MSGYNESDFYDTESENNSGGGLRDYIKSLEKKVSDLSTQLTSESREKAVTDLLKDKGLDPAIGTLIPKDVDPKAWLESNGRLFISSVPAAEQEQAQPEIKEVQQDDPAVVAERQAREQMLSAQESGTPAVTQSDVDRVAQMSYADIMAEIAKAQAVNG